ncbi:hypothetical protein PoB_002628800 [Plakobranchus ocellatus]|uniref:Uncharacterized protein n=1 Tax=Plakobranchus ocellatus TaxID=259542 RepID=A0AAV3ZY11_9GAST|nr:hypothetical protein PoB_002628800 [Plakobranchus ocellatus]
MQFFLEKLFRNSEAGLDSKRNTGGARVQAKHLRQSSRFFREWSGTKPCKNLNLGVNLRKGQEPPETNHAHRSDIA